MERLSRTLARMKTSFGLWGTRRTPEMMGKTMVARSRRMLRTELRTWNILPGEKAGRKMMRREERRLITVRGRKM